MTPTFEAEDYGYYIEQDFRYRWLRPHFLYEKLEKFKAHSNFAIRQVGESVEERPIYALNWGQGLIKVLCWTQMHGNEPTATMAVVDLLNFFSATDKYDGLRDRLREHLEICIIPMVNPDGAELFTRRNAVHIDLNRDAVACDAPEMKVLLQMVDEFKPHWAFNLHDQRNIFSAGNSANPATMSFLSASAEESKAITPARTSSMQVIGRMAALVEEHLPGHTGRYTDEFYPRSLGEYFHAREIPCILIESGAYTDDFYRDVARKFNFLTILEALQLIVSEDYQKEDLIKYRQIPENHTNIMDIVVRNCEMVYQGKTLNADVGFLYREKPDFDTGLLNRVLLLNDIGDLSFHYGLREETGGVINVKDQELKLGEVANLRIKRENKEDLIFINGILQ